MRSNMPNRETLTQDFERFLGCLVAATAQIADEYILLPIDGAPLPIYRERVYCYELYHQLRVQMGDNFGYSLGGEVDKRAHPIMGGRDITNVKPDLLVHRPGDMGGNLTVIEVKPVNANRRDIQKDLRTLTAFRQRGRYHRAIYLIYGPDENKFHTIKTTALELQREDTEGRVNLELITLLWHPMAGVPAISMEWEAS
jgi:hypothetical protein